MASENLWMDPVEHGKPSASKILLGLVVLNLAAAATFATGGDWFEAVDALLIAGVVYALDRTRRTAWLAGYYAATDAVAERIEEDADD